VNTLRTNTPGISLSVGEVLARAARELESVPALRAHAAQDTALLLRHVLQLSAASMRAHPDRILTAEQEKTFADAIARRLTCEPIQYITGEQEFFGIPLRVSPAVLIPRPETELLVEAVLAELAQRPPLALARILDVGTGAGAIALALAHHLPTAQITALDISSAALDLARANAGALGLTSRIRFLRSDLLQALPPGEPLFHVIVSNPPYVPDPDRPGLPPEVRDFEPAQALFAGPDGLDVYHRLIPSAARHLCPGGLLALEFGYGQREALAGLLRDWEDVRFLNDLQGIPRAALAHSPL
jgi:release factor glutamine methyltransferase